MRVGKEKVRKEQEVGRGRGGWVEKGRDDRGRSQSEQLGKLREWSSSGRGRSQRGGGKARSLMNELPRGDP